MDKGFYSIGVIHLLNARSTSFILLAVIRGQGSVHKRFAGRAHYEQRDIWNLMRDHTCGWLGGRDFTLPGTVGDESGKIRMMNISKDFGVDPHATAWGMECYYDPMNPTTVPLYTATTSSPR